MLTKIQLMCDQPVYFKTSWIQQHNINYLQKTQYIKDILWEHKLTQHLHMY